MASISRVLRGVLRNWGHDIRLQRRTPDGSGWENRLEIHTVRHQYPNVRALTQAEEERREGVVHSVDMLYYFKADAHPKEGDRIYERDTRFSSGQTTWIIDYAIPMKGKGGVIEYYIAGCTRESPN